MTTPESNTAKTNHVAEAMQDLASAGETGGGGGGDRSSADNGDETKVPGDPKPASDEARPKPAGKGSGKGPGKATGKGSGKVPDDRGPPPPLPKPIATFNL